MFNRSMPVVLAALTLAAMPAAALASDEPCNNNPECDDGQENVTATVPAPAPAPAPEAAPAPAPEASAPAPEASAPSTSPSTVTHALRQTTSTPTSTPSHPTRAAVKHATVRHTTIALRPVPVGGVQAGEGGTAPQAPNEVLLGLAGGSLLLLASGGGLLARARRNDS